MSLYNLGDHILSYRDRNIELPVDLTDSLSTLGVEAYHRFNDKLLIGSKEQGKLATFELLSQLLNYTEYIQTGSIPHKIGIYITDDVNILAFLHMLGFKRESLPTSATVFIEFHSDDEGLYLNFLYNSVKLDSSECGVDCRVPTFKEGVLKRMYKTRKSWHRACFRTNDAPVSLWKQLFYPGLMVIGILLFFKLNTRFAIWAVRKLKRE